ncbi:uncharacterized protein LOC114941163 [Nylanderia fulva]|uniref:uncharacterized protein LOC114941163 n=1 Tax=Nylanderia fulva TaxID=613905 RepID=UPI0010FB6A13|nr:uncharacterized protein LOC114941163 [Nylanderia fulva]
MHGHLRALMRPVSVWPSVPYANSPRTKSIAFRKRADILRSDVYMDDIVSGAENQEEAESMVRQLTNICTAGGFTLKKWSTNASYLLSLVEPDARLQQEARWWLPGESHSTLGLRWQPCDDRFAFATHRITLSAVTKSYLATRSRLGRVSAKRGARNGCDSRGASGIGETSRALLVRALADSHQEVHGFADASERAYAAVIYLRTNTNGVRRVTLLAAKTKLDWSPTSCLLLAQKRRLSICGRIPRDSRLDPGPPFVLGHLRRLIGELVDHSLWWQGPSWLSSESQPWTINCEEPPEDDLPESASAPTSPPSPNKD